MARDGELRRARAARSAARSPSSRRCSTRSAGTRGSGSASTPATSSPPATTSATPARSTTLVAEVDETIGLDRLCALHVNDSATPLGSNRDRHANILEGEIGEGLGAFLAHPAFQELGAYMEVPGAGDGVDANEMKKLRELHAALDEACDAGADRRRMDGVTSFAQAAETAPRRRVRLPRLVHGRPVPRRGSRRRDLRAGAAALASLRPEARLGPHLALPGRADGRARPLPLREAPAAARAARGVRRSGSRSGSSRGSRPSSRPRSAR